MDDMTLESGAIQNTVVTFPLQEDEEGMYTLIFGDGGGTLNITDFDTSSGKGQTLITVEDQSGGLGNIVIPEALYKKIVGAYYPEDGNTYLSFQTDSVYQNSVVFQYSGNIFNLPDDTQTDMTTALSESGNKVYLPACFLPDTLIETPEGPCAVQNMTVGQTVLVCEGRETISKKVTWVGRKKAKINPGKPDDEAGYPVRILKDALSDGVPYKDMLITPEHCLFLENRFIPVRMLVNGRSIFYDRAITNYEYYHIETASHSIISADGVLTESYLDTGNRKTFQQLRNVFILGGPSASWDRDAAAPLCTSRDFVEPLFHQITTRAQNRGLPEHSGQRMLSEDANLYLLTETGEVLWPVRYKENQAIFVIPGNVKTVRIISNTSRPCDVIGPFVDDRRHLGVAVQKVQLIGREGAITVTTHLTNASLEGWLPLENDGTRWTNGNAALPLRAAPTEEFMHLALQIVAKGPYCMAPEKQLSSQDCFTRRRQASGSV